MDGRERATAIIYVCCCCGEDFEVAERNGVPGSPEVTCPECGSDLLAVDCAAVRHSRPDGSRRGSARVASGADSWADRRARWLRGYRVAARGQRALLTRA